MKAFNTAGPCIPAIHYMADLTKRVQAIKAMIDAGKYFRIARGHQYGKTTTLTALSMYLKADYVFLMLDFQSFGAGGFSDEGQFIKTFTRIVHKKISRLSDIGTDVCGIWKKLSDRSPESLRLDELQDAIEKLCSSSKLPVILVIDEVDHASDYQVFNSFLGMLRGAYILHAQDPSCPALQSVILAGVTDITAMHQKIRADHAHTLNSPWNIAVPFTVRMSLDIDDISGMLTEYEEDHQTGMDIRDIASLIYDYTDGYPYLVSRICQYLDETLPYDKKFLSYGKPWSREGIAEAVRVIHSEDNMLFQSVMSKVQNSETLRNFIQAILFNGKEIAFDYDSPVLRDAEMYGLIKNRHNTVQIANRIFETRLYDHFLNAAQLSDMLTNPLQLTDKKR